MAFVNGVIYNLASFLRTELPTYAFFINKREAINGEETVPDKCILLRETGGEDGKNFQFNWMIIQVLTRAVDNPTARKMSYDIFNKIHNTMGLELNAITVGMTTYPMLKTSAIYSVQSPSDMGLDENGLSEYSNNYQIFYKGE